MIETALHITLGKFIDNFHDAGYFAEVDPVIRIFVGDSDWWRFFRELTADWPTKKLVFPAEDKTITFVHRGVTIEFVRTKGVAVT